MAGPPAGYEEVAAPTQRTGGPPPGYEEVAPPSGASYDAYLKSGAPTRQVRPPMQPAQDRDIFGSVSPFMSQVGQRIKQNVEMIPHMLDAAQLMKGIQQKVAQGADLTPYERTLYTEAQAGGAQAKELAGAGSSTPMQVVKNIATVPRLAYQAGKGYVQNPATLVGDIVTAAPELSELRLPKNKVWGVAKPGLAAVPGPPIDAMSGLSPEQQTAYQQQVGQAWQGYNKEAQTYHDKVSGAFDTAKRDQLVQEAAHQQSLADIQAKHAAEVAKAQAEYEGASAKEAQARADHASAVEAARASREQAAAVDARRQEIQQTQQAMTEDTRQRAQQVYGENRAQLNNDWDAVRDTVGAETPTPIKDTIAALNKAETEYLRGSPGSITKFRQLATELGLSDSMGVGEDAVGDLTQAPAGKLWEVGASDTAPWQTLRTHVANIGRAMASGDLGNLYPAMKLVRDSIEKSLGQVAEQKGAGDMYRDVRTREAQFRKDFEDLGPISLGKGNPAARLVRAPNAAFAADILKSKGADLLSQALGRWDKSGDLVTNIQHLGSLAEELKNLPKVKVLPEPAPYAGTAPTLRQVPAPETPAAPGTPERTIPREQPAQPHVPPPEPAPPTPAKKGFLKKQVLPRAGGLAAASLANLPVPGHFIINYEAGKMGTEALINKLSRTGASRTRGAMPPTPEAYHREIVGARPDTKAALAAKFGLTSRGEADRRIVKSGGNVKVRPIPQPTE